MGMLRCRVRWINTIRDHLLSGVTSEQLFRRLLANPSRKVVISSTLNVFVETNFQFGCKTRLDSNQADLYQSVLMCIPMALW